MIVMQCVDYLKTHLLCFHTCRTESERSGFAMAHHKANDIVHSGVHAGASRSGSKDCVISWALLSPLFSICCTVQCYPGLLGVCCAVHCAYFSVYIYHSWILPIWHAIICVDASNDCSPPSQCRQGCLLLLCNACVFNLWNITSCLIVVATTVV